MTQVLVLVLALLIGVIAGLRAMTAPAVVAWGAMLGWIDVTDKWSEWMAHPITVTVLTILLVGELITDQLPKTPSRKVPPQFIARLVTGGFSGAVIGSAFFHTFSATGAGVVGAEALVRRLHLEPRQQGDVDGAVATPHVLQAFVQGVGLG